jgi:hypothetical protein
LPENIKYKNPNPARIVGIDEPLFVNDSELGVGAGQFEISTA